MNTSFKGRPEPSNGHLAYTTLPLARKLNRARIWGIAMKNKLLSGTACAALCLVSFSGAARSATLDDVMARLDKIEKENAELRAKVRSLSVARPAALPMAAPPTLYPPNHS